MNQDQEPRPWWKDNWPVLALAALVVVIATITGLGYGLGWAWTGLSTKSAWDWLQLLIIPVLLALGALWFNRQERRAQNELETRRQESAQALAREERENDRKIAEDRVREEALQRYLDRMQELMLDKGLRSADSDKEIRDVARVRALTILRSLDGNRKGQAVRFLYEADLMGRAYEEETEIREAIIKLERANLREARLKGAELRGVDLTFTDLRSADLRCADFTEAYLITTDLREADLRGAELGFANLSGANMGNANLSGATNWTHQQLAQARSLVGATMPDGTKMTKERWEEFKKRYRQ
jgi:hypothetical protein